MSTRNLRKSIDSLNAFGFQPNVSNSTKSLKKPLISLKALNPSNSRQKFSSDSLSMEGYAPQWLLNRKDFQNFLLNDQSYPQKFLQSITKPCSQRCIIDNQNIINWLQHCKLLKKLKVSYLLKVSKNIQIENFSKSFKFTQESLKNKLFIIVEGSIRVYRDNIKSSVLKPKEYFGNFMGLKSHNHYICLEDTKLASIDSSFFSEISYSISQKTSIDVFKILNSQEVFCRIIQPKLMLLSKKFVKTVFKENDFVYKENEKCENFFIVKSGQIQLQKSMTLTKKHHLPIQQVLISKKHYNYIITNLEKWAIFAFEEFIEAKNYSCTAKALTNVKVYTINIKDFLEIIDINDKENIFKGLKNKFPVLEIKQRFIKNISNSVRRIKTIIETVEKTDRITIRNDKKKRTWAEGATDYYNSISTSQFISEKIEFQNIFPINANCSKVI